MIINIIIIIMISNAFVLLTPHWMIKDYFHTYLQWFVLEAFFVFILMERPSFILYCYINYPGRIAYKKDAVHAGTNRKNNLGSLFAIAMRPCKSIANSLPFCAIKITQDRVWEYPNSQLHSSVIDHYFNPYFRLVYVSFSFYCFIWRKFFSFSFYVCTVQSAILPYPW